VRRGIIVDGEFFAFLSRSGFVQQGIGIVPTALGRFQRPTILALNYNNGVMMHPDIKENYQEKIRLTIAEIIVELGEKFKAMLAKHAAEGMIGSGSTIKRTMDFIAEGNANLYKEILGYFQALDIAYSPQLETDIQELAKSAQKLYKAEAFALLKKGTKHAGSPELYERMLSDVEASMATDIAKFHNQLNATLVKLMLSNRKSPTEIFLWSIEGVLLLILMFISGMWYKDPTGNYEPVIVGLGFSIPLIALGIKSSRNK
jgi:hypothetical protein